MNRQAVAVVREEWRVVDRWWTEEPVSRRYFEVVLESGQNVVVFRDEERGGWFSSEGRDWPSWPTWTCTGLTAEEIEVAKLAGQVYLKFKQLPQAHPADLGEVAFTSTRSGGSCSRGPRSAPTPSTGRSSSDGGGARPA